MADAFFSRAEVKELLDVAATKMNLRQAINPPQKVLNLHAALKILRAHTTEFDEHCQTNIEWFGRQFLEDLETYTNLKTPVENVDVVYSAIYRFVVELELSLHNDLSMELRQFRGFTEDNLGLFDEQSQSQMKFALQTMPIAIMKRLLGTEVLRNVRNIATYAAEVDKQISGWDTRLAEHESKAESLKVSLDSYATGFNFVGLYDGFDQLSTAKTKELAGHRKWLLLFGLLAVMPIAAEFLILSWNVDRINELRWALLIVAIPALPITVLFIYFFRIVLRSFDATKSQLLQLELRKTLCRFIQNYAEYAKTLKASNVDSLAKFENIIFSGLVSSDEKLPATFDGLEQLTNMVKAFQK